MPELIRRKRSGGALTPREIQGVVQGALSRDVPDYQLAALLMAVVYEGLSYEETEALTCAFVESGRCLDWREAASFTVDKHSTGGVGDKVSLALVPWLASLGLRVPKMSGRGLGHTGGTIDKLESIPGFRTDLCEPEISQVLEDVGCVVVSQSRDLVPADRLFYELRNATDTVDELGLIAASVMSKKIAGGAGHIVLDVKCGRGAFFKDLDRAGAFALLASRLAQAWGRGLACVISSMDQPLGRAVGNALEVSEVADFLAGRASQPDLEQLCLALGGAALLLSGKAATISEAESLMSEALARGLVWERFQAWVQAQGGSMAQFAERLGGLSAYRRIAVTAPRMGFVERLDALQVGELVRSLGAGRLRKDDRIDPLVGVECLRKVGDSVSEGDELAILYAKPDDPRTSAELSAAYLVAVTISASPAPPKPVVLDLLPRPSEAQPESAQASRDSGRLDR
jgi:pyrimidine-nucleoside phosphorylase